MIICNECEFASAIIECETCKGIIKDCFFCKECSRIHNRKCDDTHIFKKLIQQNFFCSNCETNTSKFLCLDCPLTDQNLCFDCSIYHPKVKATRNHRVRQKCINNEAPPLLSYKQRLTALYRNLLATTPISEFLEVLEIDIPLPDFIPIQCIMIFAGIAIFFLTRRLMGDNSSSVLTIIGSIVLLRFIQQRQKGLKSIKKS
jgi:hypothetical protein